MCHRQFFIITTICLLLTGWICNHSNGAQQLIYENGVIIQKTGSAYLFIFPTPKGAITATANPAGKISVGHAITVMYALKLNRSARFIALDTTRAHRSVQPKLETRSTDKAFGFLVRDSRQPKLDIIISPSFMAKVKQIDLQTLKEQIASQGNLNVTIGADVHGHLKIMSVVLD